MQKSQRENTKGQSWTDKGTSNEAGSQVGEHTQQHPTQAGIHSPVVGLPRSPRLKRTELHADSATRGSTFWLELFQEPFSEGGKKEERQIFANVTQKHNHP